ncbi:sulfotransferase [Tautonia sociabilis]|uniref:Sulfotransferase family protein n=1 Tax=Tautonia sociabilis TaxID=2080755 RepID=A0A432MFR0_9BACT|nr:sulfotransferase [Tautonia sociabilis]RUL84936.1 hypothetical protein TsocGM_19540 [Tautonia sociabilis]
MSSDGSTRDALLVLGMHRSGTSALTRVLSLLGAELPGRLMQPQPGNNETGFWEPIEIVEIHDELLRSVGSSWDDVTEFPRAWFDTQEADRYVDRLVDRVLENYRDAPLIVLKDPRICRFLPLWLRVLDRASARPHFVIPVRNPLEVAASLKRRDGFPIAKSALLWLRHVLDAERDSRGHPRAFVEYDQLLVDWKRVTDRIAEGIGLSWPHSSHRSAVEIEAFLSDAHRHNRFTREEFRSHSQIVGWVKSAYGALIRAAAGDARAPGETLDRIRGRIRQADLAYGPVVADARARLERAEAGLQAAEQSARTLADEKARAEAEALGRAESLAVELEQARRTIADQQDQMARERLRMEADLQEAEADRDRLRAELEKTASDRGRLEALLLTAEADRDRLRTDRDRIEADRDRIEAERLELAGRLSERSDDLRRVEAERDAARADREAVYRILAEQMEAARAAHAEAVRAYLGAESERQRVEAALAELTGSRFWRYTGPIRAVGPMARRAGASIIHAPHVVARGLRRRLINGRPDQ